MKHFLDGLEVTPKNTEEIEFTIDKTDRGMDVSLNLSHLIFVNEAKKKIEEYIQTNGYFKGIPYEIVFDNGFNLSFFLDQTDKFKKRDTEVEIAIKKRYGNQQFWEVLNATSFDSLGSTWEIESQTIKRVVVSVDQHLEILSLTANLMTIAKAVMDRFYDYADLYASFTASAFVSPAMLTYALLKMFALLVKTLQLMIEITLFIDRVTEFVFPRVEEFKVQTIKSILMHNLYQLGIIVEENDFLDYFADIAYVGTTYKSQLNTGYSLEIVERTPSGNPSSYDYFKQATYEFTSVGGFVSWFLDAFNAKIKRIDDHQIRFVRRDAIDGVVNGITSGLPLQQTRSNEETPNTNENWQRCLVKFNLDDSEAYTSFMIDEHASEWLTSKAGLYFESGLNLIRGYKKVDLMFAQGFAYNSINVKHFEFVQEVKEKLSKFFTSDKLLNYLSGSNPYEGYLVTSSYTYNIPKIVRLIGDGKISVLTAEEIFLNFHEIDFLKNNSYMIHDSERFECNEDLFVNLYDNDHAQINGVVSNLEQIRYKPYFKEGNFIYKKPSNYADDLTLTKVL